MSPNTGRHRRLCSRTLATRRTSSSQNTDVTICLGENDSGLPQAGPTAKTAAWRAAAGQGARNWEGLHQELTFVLTGTWERGRHLIEAQGGIILFWESLRAPFLRQGLRATPQVLFCPKPILPVRDFSSLEAGEEPPHQSHDSATEAPPRAGLAVKAGLASLPGLPCTPTHSSRDYEAFLGCHKPLT